MPPLEEFVHCSPEIYYPEFDFQPGHYVICDGLNDKSCSAQNFPNWQKWGDTSYTRYHHNYLGVDTTGAACKAESENCKDDIEGSWCNRLIPCNEEVRGHHVHCTSASLFQFGKCHCDDGYCPVAGKCVLEAQAQSMITADTSPGIQIESPPLNPALFLAAAASTLGCLLVLAAYCVLTIRTRPRDLSQGLLGASAE